MRSVRLILVKGNNSYDSFSDAAVAASHLKTCGDEMRKLLVMGIMMATAACASAQTWEDQQGDAQNALLKEMRPRIILTGHSVALPNQARVFLDQHAVESVRLD